MNRIFVSFASSDLNRSLKRIERQAQKMQFYDRIDCLTETDLNPAFRAKFAEHLQYGSPGFGYWCWKPQILLQILEKTNPGDIIQYTDAGCHLNKNGIKRLEEYFILAENAHNGILAFQAGKPGEDLMRNDRTFPDFPDYQWVKGDLLDYFDVRFNREITETPTIGAGIIFLKNSPQALEIVKSWLHVIERNFGYIDNTPSISPNLPGFIEHRHDQAIFSLICKKFGVSTLSAMEYWYPARKKLKPDWTILKNYPIHAKRDKKFRFVKSIQIIGNKIKTKTQKHLGHFFHKR